jgi:hypothetical protein
LEEFELLKNMTQAKEKVDSLQATEQMTRTVHKSARRKMRRNGMLQGEHIQARNHQRLQIEYLEGRRCFGSRDG